MRPYSRLALVLGSIAVTGCATTPHIQEGAVLGGATGAIIGSIIGHHDGNTGEGALIGAGIGALTGAVLADAEEQRYRREVEYYRHAPTPLPPPPPRPSTHGSVRSYKIENRPPENGHWETQVIRGETGERYEERVWIPDP